MAKILNLELSFETQFSKKKFSGQINQGFIVYMLKKHQLCFIVYLYFLSFKLFDER